MTLKSDRSVVTKLNGRIFAVESASLGQMVKSGKALFKYSRGSKDCQHLGWVEGDLGSFCVDCDEFKPLTKE